MPQPFNANDVRAYVLPPIRDRGLYRVSTALSEHAPKHVRIVDAPEDSTIIVMHVYGRRDKVRAAVEHHAAQRRVVLVQYSVRSTQKPHTRDWVDIWRSAFSVWSSYDLAALMENDGVTPPSNCLLITSPFGANHDVFTPDSRVQKRFTVASHADSEGGYEVAQAVARLSGATHWHLGRMRPWLSHAVVESNITDAALAQRLRQCHYVAPLRRKEGFELLAAEGLLCGSRPILYDIPQYRRWYDDVAVFVPHADQQTVIGRVADVLSSEYRPITDSEAARVRARFDWSRIVPEVWSQWLS